MYPLPLQLGLFIKEKSLIKIQKEKRRKRKKKEHSSKSVCFFLVLQLIVWIASSRTGTYYIHGIYEAESNLSWFTTCNRYIFWMGKFHFHLFNAEGNER